MFFFRELKKEREKCADTSKNDEGPQVSNIIPQFSSSPKPKPVSAFVCVWFFSPLFLPADWSWCRGVGRSLMLLLLRCCWLPSHRIADCQSVFGRQNLGEERNGIENTRDFTPMCFPLTLYDVCFHFSSLRRSLPSPSLLSPHFGCPFQKRHTHTHTAPLGYWN